MKTYNDLNTMLAMTHADDLLRESERLRLLKEARKSNETVPDRMVQGIGGALISGGQWLIDRNKGSHSAN